MKTNKKKGFTLVELLAVIVVLAIILVIAVPKVMTVIEDSKKATLESTAKMIASAAEKANVQNSLLGRNEEITCESVAKINDTDYANCSIEFTNNTAFVSIEGKGKFEGLSVCNGTKSTAEATTDGCGIEYVNAVTYLSDKTYKIKYAFPPSAATYDSSECCCEHTGECSEYSDGERIKYNEGKIYYNCDEKDSNGIEYLKNGYDYENACELWEIQGIYEVEDDHGNVQKRIKLRNYNSTFEASWDSSSSDVNNGVGINQWGASGAYEGADLMRLLNGYYIGEDDECRYCDGLGQETCENICDKNMLAEQNMKPLTSIAKEMINDAKWDTYAFGGYDCAIDDCDFLFPQIKGITKQYNGKSGCVDGNTKCTDDVERTTSWIGLVGIPYKHEVGESTHSINTYYVNESEYVTKYVEPSVYLKSETYIVCGYGTEKSPYILSSKAIVNPSVCPSPKVSTSTSTATSEEATSTSTATS